MNQLLGCAQCNMTARISPTERPDQRIRSGADHARVRRDTARTGRGRWTARPIAHRCVTEIRAQQLATTPATNGPSRQTAEQMVMKQRRAASCVAEKRKKKKLQEAVSRLKMDTVVWGGGAGVKCGCGTGGEAEGEISPRCPRSRRKKKLEPPKHRRCSECRAKKDRTAAEFVREEAAIAAAAGSSCRPVAAIVGVCSRWR